MHAPIRMKMSFHNKRSVCLLMLNGGSSEGVWRVSLTGLGVWRVSWMGLERLEGLLDESEPIWRVLTMSYTGLRVLSST